jgi:hypothetical protein
VSADGFHEEPIFAFRLPFRNRAVPGTRARRFFLAR